MAPSKRGTEDILARVNFPLYTLQMLTERHVIVGGGGGQSKTGIANGFEIFELSHTGTKFTAQEVTRHETGSSSVMVCSTYSDNKRTYLVAGQESHCQLYHVESILVNEDEKDEMVEEIGNHHIKQRKPKAKQKTDNNKNSKRLQFVIKPSDCVQTDFEGDEPLLRVTRINHSGNLLATGGTDGLVRVWRFPGLQPLHVLKAHKKEIDDIDFSLYDNYLVTIAKDGAAILWDAVKGRELNRLTWQQPEGVKYLYKRSRFGVIEGADKKCALYMITNPPRQSRKQKKHKSYLQQWLPDGGILKKVAEINEEICALNVRDDGRFIAIGTNDTGSVSIYIAFSLQKVLHIPGAHSFCITGLEFLPVARRSCTISHTAEAAVLSISIDNSISIHTLPYRKTLPAWLGIVILVFTLFLTFVFCSYIGL